MNIAESLNNFIAENGGNSRDALNVALARLDLVEKMLQAEREKEVIDLTLLKENQRRVVLDYYCVILSVIKD